jgi:hypothetical protein
MKGSNRRRYFTLRPNLANSSARPEKDAGGNVTLP